MQPERKLATAEDWLLSVAAYRGLPHQGRAKSLWRELLRLAGCRSGTVTINEAGMLTLVGGNSVRESNGSPGPLDRLEQIGAVESANAQGTRWYVRTVADLDKPRPAVIENDPQKLLLEPPDDQPAMPPVVRLRDGAGVRPESGALNGGKEGRCALDSQSKQEEQEGSCSSSLARESHGTPVTLDAIKKQLIEAGVYVAIIPKLLGATEARPADVAHLIKYFRTNPDHLDLNAGALKVAIENWRPGLAYDALGLWPQVKLPQPADPARRTSDRQLADKRESERWLIVLDGRKSGLSVEKINEQLQQRGMEGICDPKEPGFAAMLRARRGLPPRGPAETELLAVRKLPKSAKNELA